MRGLSSKDYSSALLRRADELLESVSQLKLGTRQCPP